MHRRHLRVLALAFAALASGCGSSALTLGDGGADIAPRSDGGFDFVQFAAQVQMENASCTTANCAVPLPADAVASPAAARDRVQALIAIVYGVPPAQVTANVDMTCSTSGGATCASHFNHDLYKGDGCRGDKLLPSAQVVERQASGVELIIWTVTSGGLTLSPAVSIEGVQDGRLLGLAFFFDRTVCAL